MQAPPTPAPLLAAENLACRRGDRLLFRRLSFRLEAGAACHVTGANGAGKTTLIRALAGLTTPYAGEVRREGELGLLDERTGLDPDLPLGRALAFWERIDGCTSPDSAITVLGLQPLLDVPVRFLSTGQRKRAALAALLNRGVPIWLLDEPLSGLDVETIAKVTALIRLHIGGGGIALIASHQPLDVPGMTAFAIEDYAPAPEDLGSEYAA
jgi:heme exporter protein A